MSVSRSTDLGTSWTRSQVTDSGFTYSIMVDPASSNVVYAGGIGGLYRSTDSGASWSDISNGITGDVNAICRDPAGADILYAGTADGIFKTTDAGANWTNTGCSDVRALIIDPDSPGSVYAGTANGAFKSTDSGISWSGMNQGIVDSNVTSLGINAGSHLFAGTGSAGMFRWNFTAVEEADDPELETNFAAVPNPFNSHTTIRYSVVNQSRVDLSIYDVQGRLVKRLVSDDREPGHYAAVWFGCDRRGNDVRSGIYFCRFQTGDARVVRKLVLLR